MFTHTFRAIALAAAIGCFAFGHGAAQAQPSITAGPTVTDQTPSPVSPGDLEAGDVVNLAITIGGTDNTFRGPAATWLGMSLSLDLSAALPGLQVVSYEGLAAPNCGGTGPSPGASTASWTGMATDFSFVSFPSQITCNIGVSVRIPSGAAPGLYTVPAGTLAGLERPLTYGASSYEISGPPVPFSISTGPFSFTVAADATPPVATITSSETTVSVGDVFSVGVSFDEPVTGFDVGDVAASSGTISNFTTNTDETGAITGGGFDVTATTAGTITLSFPADGVQDEAGNDNLAAGTVDVTVLDGQAELSMAFTGPAPAPGDTTTLQFTLDNTSPTEAVSGASFTLNLNGALSGLAAQAPLPTDPCGTGSTISGTTSLTFSGGNLIANDSCTFSVTVLVPGGATPNSYSLATNAPAYTLGSTGRSADPASTTLTVAGAEGAGAPLQFSKSFTNDPVVAGGTVTLQYTIVPEEGTDATNLAFTDDLDAALSGLVATALPASNVCGAGSTLSGTSTITLSGGNVADGATCTFSVTLQTPGGASAAAYPSTTSDLTGSQDDGGGPAAIDSGFTASDSLTLFAAAPQVQVTGPAGPVGVGVGFTANIGFSETVTGFDVGDITVVNGVASALSGDGRDFTATITPSALGTVEVSIGAGVAQDTDTNLNAASNTFTVEAVAAEPEIEVQIVGASLAITDGTASASAATLTEFGDVDVTSGTLTRTVRITNTGTSPLTIASVVLSDSTNYTAGVAPGSVAAGGSQTFTVTYDPTSLATHAGTITINSDDADEAAFDFAITGTGVAGPEIEVAGNGLTLLSGDTSPSAADHTEFVDAAIAATSSRTYTIFSLGGDALTLGANAVSITNDSAGVFSVSDQPATSIASSGTDTFTVDFTPDAAGLFSARVSIASDDPDENPYIFAIQGTGTGAPEVQLEGNSIEIVAGDTSPATADGTAFGRIRSGTTATANFTIRNTGTTNLTLSAPSGARDVFVERASGSSDFTVTAQPGGSGTIAAGGSQAFTIQYAPTADGAATAVFGFANTDADESPYQFTVSGEGVSPEIAVAGLAGADIAYTDGTPDAGDGTDFGSTGFSAGAPITRTFTISNSGGDTLTLGANAVSLSGAGVGDWTVTTQPAASVAASGGETTFAISFDPSVQSLLQATVSIANDDGDEAPFTFAIQGTGLDDAAPTGYTVAFDQDPVTAANQTAVSFTFAGAEIGADYAYTITSDAGMGSVPGSGTIATATDQITGIDVSSLGDGTLTLSVTLTDTATNEGDAATDTAVKDTVGPAVSFSTDSASPFSGQFVLTVSFSSPVTGFDITDVSVTNGAIDAFSGSGDEYDVIITPTADGPVTVDIDADGGSDAAGNGNSAAQYSGTADLTAPTTTISSAAAGPVSGVFSIAVDFSEPVSGFTTASLIVGNGTASNVAGTGAAYTVDITPTAGGQVTVDIPAGATTDEAGNLNLAAPQFTIQADLTVPTVTSVAVSDADLRFEDVGDTFTLTVTFSKPMDPAAAGTVAFDADLSGTLSTTTGALNDDNTAWILTATVLDGGQTLPGVDVAVSGFADSVGTSVAAYSQADVFAVATARAGLTVSVDVTGLADGAFDFSGDLGDFQIDTNDQAGAAVFNALTEGDYTFTLSDPDGFSLDTISCTGADAVTDASSGQVTVTLAPADSAECAFGVIGDPGVDPNVAIDVPLSLPANVDDPTSVSATFPLTNTGGAPLDYRIDVDVDWLSVTPNEGTIPAGGTVEFTVAFTDAVLALTPGSYTATISFFNLSSGASTPAGGASGTQSLRSQAVALFEIPITVEIVARNGTLTLIATTAPDIAGDGSFGFTSDIAAVDGRTLATSNGTSSLGPLDVLNGQYSITQIAPEGWRLDSISCAGDTDGGSSFDVGSASLALDLDSGESLTCTFANVRDEAYVQLATATAIRDFMAQRADQLLTMSPSIGDRLRRGRAQAANGFSADFTEGRFDSAFSLSLSGMREMGRAGDPFADGDEPAYAGFDFSNASAPGVIDVWVQASYSGVEDDRAGLSSSNRFGLVYLGADMMINEDLLAGVLIQYDHMETTTGELRSQVEGDGWLAGPYMAMRIGENLYFDARGAWGRSDNTIDPLGFYADDFETDRWLLEANLAGEVFRGNWRITPEAGLAWFSEGSDAYTDSLGFAISGQSVTLGRLRFGPEFAYRFVKSERAYIEPYLSLQAIYNFDQAEVINATGFLEGLSEFRADARLGLNAEFDNGARLSGEISLSGLGQGDFDATSAMIRLRTPLSMP